MKEHLNILALDIFQTAKDNNIDIEVEWIPRTQNERADYLSKIVDYDDWTVKDCYFHAGTSIWSPCSVDCFASYKNRRVSRFYSKYFNPDSLGIDSLAFSWVGETCWLVPPVSLVKVILHVSVAVGSLLALSPLLAPFGRTRECFQVISCRLSLR